MTTSSSAPARNPGVDVRRAADRFATDIGWLDSHHSFSFGHHYDPRNTGHGLLLVNNDDIVRGGSGFDTHPHRDMEIVTWVLSGELEHKDSEKNRGVLYPGLAQRMSAGRGIWHSEMNNSGTDDVHFVQMWVTPDTESIDPGLRAARHQRRAGQGRPRPDRLGQGPRRGHLDPPGRRRAVRRPAARRRDRPRARRPPRPRLRPASAAAICNRRGVLGSGDAARLTERRSARPHGRRGRRRGVDLGDRLTS